MRAFGSASDMVATSLDSKESSIRNYSRASVNLNELENHGCTIVHGVDIDTIPLLDLQLLDLELFDRIVFNFPHPDFDYPDCTPYHISLERDLVRGVFKSASKILRHGGEVHVTSKKAYPYCYWEIVRLAKEAGFFLVEEVPFQIWDYPFYINKRGSGSKCDESFPVGACSTFEFSARSI